MTSSFRQQSAKIYEFRPRTTKVPRGLPEDAKPAIGLRSQQVADVALCGSWYHEAAIQEAEQSRKS